MLRRIDDEKTVYTASWLKKRIDLRGCFLSNKAGEALRPSVALGHGARRGGERRPAENKPQRYRFLIMK